MSWGTQWWLSALLLGAVACDGGHTVIADLRTDFVPGGDFVWVRTTLVGGGEVRQAASLGEDFLSGVQIAEFGEVPAGSHRLRVALLDGLDHVVAERDVLISVSTHTVVTVVMTTDCLGVMCAADQTCLGGACVDLACTERDGSPECGDRECSTNVDCPGGVACSQPLCREGVCFLESVPSACTVDEFCAVSSGCETLPTAVDAGSRPPDSGLVDSGRVDSGFFDSGIFDAGASDGAASPPSDAGPGDAGSGPGGCLAPLADVSNSIAGEGQCVFVTSRYAYVGLSDAARGFQIFAVDGPTPVPLGVFRTDDGGPADTPNLDDVLGIQVIGNYAYLATYQGGLVIVDVSDPATPTFSGLLDLSGESWAIESMGSYIFVGNHSLGVVVVDVSDPTAPSRVTNLPLTGSTQDLHLDGTRLYAASSRAFQVVDVSTPTAPTLAGEVVTGTRLYEVWSPGGGTAYVTDLDARQILTIDATVSPPSVLNRTTPDSIHDFRVLGGAGSTLVLGLGSSAGGAVRLYDISAAAPRMIGEVSLATEVFGVEIVGSRTFVMMRAGSLRIFDRSGCL